ncbi:hypothetical protein [Bizionia sp.]|uniref:hypothetical protein n=1 Tax=Bizionia sp. TaxID=1954480 RepID=UPI003A922695
MSFINDTLKNDTSEAILDYIKALKRLKELGVIKNQKDFTSQLGEWLISEIFDGELAESGKQRDWDIKIDKKKYQVKAHAKSTSTNRKNTDFKYSINANIDFFVIVVFDETYKLEKIYKVPFKEAYKLVTWESKDKVIRWKDLEANYVIDLIKIIENKSNLRIFINE